MQQALALPPSLARSSEHPIVAAVRNLLQQRRDWAGSATALRDLLQPLVSSQPHGSSKTPKLSKSPRGVSQQLKHSTLTLADIGIELKFKRLRKGIRVIELHDDRGDANYLKDLQFASPDSELSSQATEKEKLTTQRLKK